MITYPYKVVVQEGTVVQVVIHLSDNRMITHRSADSVSTQTLHARTLRECSVEDALAFIISECR